MLFGKKKPPMHTAAEMELLLHKITYDFGEGFLFAPDLLAVSEQSLSYCQSGEEIEAEPYHGCRVTVYQKADAPRVYRLQKEIPTFDAGDREYDSRHELYLIADARGWRAIYATGGYKIARIAGFAKVLKLPKELMQRIQRE